MNEKNLKVISLILVVLMVANLTLFRLGMITMPLFWSVTAIIALFAYRGLPRLKNSK